MEKSTLLKKKLFNKEGFVIFAV